MHSCGAKLCYPVAVLLLLSMWCFHFLSRKARKSAFDSDTAGALSTAAAVSASLVSMAELSEFEDVVVTEEEEMKATRRNIQKT